MEAEERPTKVRKLDSDILVSEQRLDAHESPEAPFNNTNDVRQRAAAADPDHADDHEEARLSNENGDAENEAPSPSLSKNQLKKLRRQEQWEATKIFRKAKRKQKVAEKKQRKREAREQATEGAGESELTSVVPASTRKPRPILLPITFIIDCGFDDLMNDKERISLSSQLTRVYSDNHRASLQAHLAVSSFGAKLKERFESVLNNGHKNWKRVEFREEDFVDVSNESVDWMKGKSEVSLLGGAFATKRNMPLEDLHSGREVVYLSSESSDTLQELSPFSTYIVGGLVDKNRHKGICYKTACDRGIKTAKLPIADFMEMQSRSVLATNHVVEIMLRWLECGSWGEAFVKVIPKRKGGSLKVSAGPEVVDQSLYVSSPDQGQEEEQKADSVETQ